MKGGGNRPNHLSVSFAAWMVKLDVGIDVVEDDNDVDVEARWPASHDCKALSVGRGGCSPCCRVVRESRMVIGGGGDAKGGGAPG